MATFCPGGSLAANLQHCFRNYIVNSCKNCTEAWISQGITGKYDKLLTKTCFLHVWLQLATLSQSRHSTQTKVVSVSYQCAGKSRASSSACRGQKLFEMGLHKHSTIDSAGLWYLPGVRQWEFALVPGRVHSWRTYISECSCLHWQIHLVANGW